MTSLFEAPAGPELPKAWTGIAGLGEITQGGLPEGRSTLVTGVIGCGKTLLGLQFLVAGARQYGEPGVLVTFEESAEKVTANVASLGFGLDQLQKVRLLAIHAFRAHPAGVTEIGESDFDPLFLMLDDAIKRIGGAAIRDQVDCMLERVAARNPQYAERLLAIIVAASGQRRAIAACRHGHAAGRPGGQLLSDPGDGPEAAITGLQADPFEAAVIQEPDGMVGELLHKVTRRVLSAGMMLESTGELMMEPEARWRIEVTADQLDAVIRMLTDAAFSPGEPAVGPQTGRWPR
jgi:KaiC